MGKEKGGPREKSAGSNGQSPTLPPPTPTPPVPPKHRVLLPQGLCTCGSGLPPAFSPELITLTVLTQTPRPSPEPSFTFLRLKLSFMPLITMCLSVCPTITAHVRWSASPHGGCPSTQKGTPHRKQSRGIRTVQGNVQEAGMGSCARASIGWGWRHRRLQRNKAGAAVPDRCIQ